MDDNNGNEVIYNLNSAILYFKNNLNLKNALIICETVDH